MTRMMFLDADLAFEKAIEFGVLSADPRDARYAGRYMYMYSDFDADWFKHCDTRKYVANVSIAYRQPE